jgi:hypothetical protein
MYREECTARLLQLPRKDEGVRQIVLQTNFAENWHSQPTYERGDDVQDERSVECVVCCPIWAKECTVVARMGWALWTAQVEVDSIAVRLDTFGGGQESPWVVTTKMGDERSISRTRLQSTDSIGRGLDARPRELLCMHHWCVAQVCAMPPGEEAEGELAATDHRREDEPMRW